MTEPAIFKAAYADFRLIKTRGVVSISFELPVEQAQAALDVLGGMPVAATEVWCAVARLKPEKEVVQHKPVPNGNYETVPRQSDTQPSDGAPNSELDSRDGSQNSGGAPGADKAPRRRFASLPLPQQAAMLCQEGAFRVFLLEQYKDWDWHWPGSLARTTDDIFKGIVGITSKRDLQPNTPAGRLFEQIRDGYLNWKSVAA